MDAAPVLDIAEFITGVRPAVEVERILTTVLFTDIVGSTARAASLGDQLWRSLLDAHDRTVREQLRRYRGREINTTGDGFVISFDGPARAIRCALAIGEATAKLGIGLRMGMHTGECEVRGEDLGGRAMHIATAGGNASAYRRGLRLRHGQGPSCRFGYRVRRSWRARAQRVALVLEAVRRGGLTLHAQPADTKRRSASSNRPGWCHRRDPSESEEPDSDLPPYIDTSLRVHRLIAGPE